MSLALMHPSSGVLMSRLCGSELREYVIGQLKEFQSPFAGNWSTESHWVAQHKAVLAKEPWTGTAGYAVDYVDLADDAATATFQFLMLSGQLSCATSDAARKFDVLEYLRSSPPCT
jgi:hypothetical protein